MLRQGEWLVTVAEPPPATPATASGLRAVMDNLRLRADQGLQNVRDLRKLIEDERRKKPGVE
jgi:hypothetical protein